MKSKPICHPTKPHVAKGLCGACYKRQLLQSNPYYKLRQQQLVKSWRQNHPGYECGRAKIRWATNPEPLRAAAKTYHRKYPTKRAELKRNWKRKNREKYLLQMRADVKKRKALKKGAKVCDFTAAQWEQMKIDHEFRCFYCKKQFDKLTQDHCLPLSRGGDHTTSNIVPACGACNNKKNNRTLEEFLNVATI